MGKRMWVADLMQQLLGQLIALCSGQALAALPHELLDPQKHLDGSAGVLPIQLQQGRRDHLLHTPDNLTSCCKDILI